MWSGLLLDPVGLPTYINLNRKLLAESYARAVSFLKAHTIPYRLSNAGHFIFVGKLLLAFLFRAFHSDSCARPRRHLLTRSCSADLRRFLPSHNAQGKLLATPLEQEEELAARFVRGGIIVVRAFRPPSRHSS